MARKRPIRFRRIQSLLKRSLALFLFALLGFVSVFSIPALSASPGSRGIASISYQIQSSGHKSRRGSPPWLPSSDSNASPLGVRGSHRHRPAPTNTGIVSTDSVSERVEKGRELYDTGEYDRAATLWQEAAEAYIKECNKEEMLKSLINASQAMQVLGFYTRARDRLLQGLELYRLDCNSLAELTENHPKIFNWLDSEEAGEKQSAQERLDFRIDQLEKQRESLSLTQAIALRSLGNALRQIGDLEESNKLLELSLEVAQQNQSEQAAIATLLDLGNTQRALGNRERNRQEPDFATVALDIAKLFDAGLLENGPVQRALEAYKGYDRQAISYYEQAANLSSSESMRVQARLNHLSLLLDLQQSWQKAVEEAARREPDANLSYRRNLELYFSEQTGQLFARVEPSISGLQLSRASVLSQLKFARLLLNQFKLTAVADRAVSREKVVDALEAARQAASTLGDKRSQAYAIGYLGELYEQEALDARDQQEEKQLFARARKVTEQALTSLDEKSLDRDRDVAYFLYWQLGRILTNQGNIPLARSAYEAALLALDNLRDELAAIDRDVQFSFRDEVEPVYRQLVGLLLSQDAPTPDDLNAARNAIEALQLAELDNYFQDPCSQTKQVNIDRFIAQKAPNSAVIYPIVVEDTRQQYTRLEIILKLPERELRHYTTTLSKQNFEQTLGNLYQNLYVQSVAILSSRNELKDKIESLKTDKATLLASLRNVYQWLIEPLEQDLEGIDTLVFVLDGQLQNIPISALYDKDSQKYLIQKYSIALTPSLKLTDPKPLPRKNLRVLAAGVSKENQGRPELPQVEEELGAIVSLLPNSIILLDEEFSEEQFQEKLKSGDFPAVHLATHGQFSSNPEKTWILTRDKQINVSKLDNFLLTREQIGLLVLSSCETAQGDKRAVLGLAGVAVRAGASSTLATLWNVEDETASRLMQQFYRGLKGEAENPNSQLSKAEALRRAQLNFLENSDYNHPAFWAPYVLVGNWL